MKTITLTDSQVTLLEKILNQSIEHKVSIRESKRILKQLNNPKNEVCPECLKPNLITIGNSTGCEQCALFWGKEKRIRNGKVS